MRSKRIAALVCMLLLLSFALPSLAAETVRLDVNGDTMPSPGLYLTNDFCMISVDSYTRLAGAEVQWLSADDFTIIENGTTLHLSVDPVALPVGPVKTEGNTFIPLRAVSTVFDFQVEWNEEQRSAVLSRNETRDGLTVADLLAKSTAANQAYNTYSMQGLVNTAMTITEDGKAYQETPLNLTTKLTGQIQNEPLQVYMQQTIEPESGEEVPAMVVETYMNQEKIYTKTLGQDWIVQDMPFSKEFWEQQQDIQSDPLKAAAQMKEMGILLNYGNDVTVNGEDYYVVNAVQDMSKFKQSYQKIAEQITQGMPQDEYAGSSAEMQEQMQKFFDQAKMDYFYSVLINKKTLAPPAS